MKDKSQKRVGVFASLTLLMLLAFAVGAQAVLAASSVSAATTTRAGTEGRGGVDTSTATVTVVRSPVAGTQGRGGVSLAATTVTPAAGSEGRGGVSPAETPAAAPPLSGNLEPAQAASLSRARGGFPGRSIGAEPLAASSVTSTTSGWIVGGVALVIVALAAGSFAWAAGRRRRADLQESSMASYCARHPGDALCGA